MKSQDADPKKKAGSRTYDEKYLEYGFTQTSDGVLAKDSLKAFRILRHLQKRHEAQIYLCFSNAKYRGKIFSPSKGGRIPKKPKNHCCNVLYEKGPFNCF